MANHWCSWEAKSGGYKCGPSSIRGSIGFRLYGLGFRVLGVKHPQIWVLIIGSLLTYFPTYSCP